MNIESLKHEAKRKDLIIPLAVSLIVFHFVFLMVNFRYAISTPDAQGYFTQAKLIANEGKTFLEPESIIQYIGPHWLPSSNNRYFTTFPPGLPAMLAVVYKIIGPKASLLVNPLMASLSLLGLFLLCRLWLGKGWGLIAVALMAVNPITNEHALFADSHTSLIFFLIWALLFLAQWIKTDSPRWAYATGLCVGIIPTIRYPELLYCIAFALFILFYLKKGKISLLSLSAGVIGAVIPIGALCVRNWMAFGAFWRTGYGLSSEPASFGWNYFTSYSLIYLLKLIFEGSGLVFILGVIGIVILIARRETREKGMLFAILVVPITLLYMSYCWKPDAQSMRFLLPTFYIYTIIAVWLLHMITKYHYRLACAGSVILLIITVFWGFPKSILLMQHQKQHNEVLAEITDIVENHVEPGSIIITNEGIDQHLDFIGNWRLVDISILNIKGHGISQMITNSQSIQKKPLRNVKARIKYACLEGEELFNTFFQDVWQWAGKGRKVFLIVKEDQISEFKSHLSLCDSIAVIGNIKISREKNNYRNMPKAFRPSKGFKKEPIASKRLMGPNQIYDFILNGEPLFLVEWTRIFR